MATVTRELEMAIVGDIYTSHAAMENLRELCDGCGSRFAGAPGERRAAEHLAERFRAYGLLNVALEPYPYTGWTRGEARVEVLTKGALPLTCISLPYSPAADVEAELISVESGTEETFSELGAEVAGKIVLAKSRAPDGYPRWIHRKEKFNRSVLAS